MTEQTNAEVQTEKKDDIAERLAQLEATNKRLLEESKGYKEKYQKIRDEISGKEREALEAKGAEKELVESYKNEAFEKAQQLEKLKRKALDKELKFEVAKYATDAHKLEAVLRNLPTSMIQIDEESLTVSGVKEAIDHLRKEEAFLFKQAVQPSTITAKPAPMIAGKKSLSELSGKEKDERLKDALAQFIK